MEQKFIILVVDDAPSCLAMLKGYDKAIIGVAANPNAPSSVVYSAGDLINEVVKELGVSHFKALDLFIEEIEPLNAGPGSPIYVWTARDMAEFKRIEPLYRRYRHIKEAIRSPPPKSPHLNELRARIFDFLATWLPFLAPLRKYPAIELVRITTKKEEAGSPCASK